MIYNIVNILISKFPSGKSFNLYNYQSYVNNHISLLILKIVSANTRIGDPFA